MMRRSTMLLAACSLAALLARTSPASAGGCPTTVRFEPNGANATLDAGWSGLAHDVPVFDTVLDLGVSCAASTPPCGTCAITGTAPNPVESRLRCRTDTSKACTVATEVADCGAADTCRYHLNPPQSLGTGGVAFCATTERRTETRADRHIVERRLGRRRMTIGPPSLATLASHVASKWMEHAGTSRR